MDLDNFNQLIGTGINIYGSRERIRSQLIDFAQSYLELKTVDFYKTSVLSYIVDVLSILSANHLFYDSMIYREFFMVEAQLQESVYNLVRWIGYEVPKAVASKTSVLITIPLTFTSPEVKFAIPYNFKTYAGDIPFTANSTNINVASATFKFNKAEFDQLPAATGSVLNNSALTVKDSNGFFRPVYISNADSKGTQYASFTLPFTQHERVVEQFIVPETIQPYQFYSKKLSFEGMISAIRVWMVEPNTGEKISIDTTNADDFNPEDIIQSYMSGTQGNYYKWQEWEESADGIYTLAPNSTQFVFVGGINRAEIFFGNGIIGKQPARNSAVTIEYYITQGENGHIIPATINEGDKLYYSVQARYDSDGNITDSGITSKLFTVGYQVTNPTHSAGGLNTPTLPEIKRNAIVNLRSKGKLVSEMDYDDINTIMGPDFPTVESYPLLKRSDIKVNEIMVFTLLRYHDEEYLPQIVPTRNAKMEFLDPTFDSDGLYTVMRTSKVVIDGDTYETLFNMTLNRNTRLAYYDYVLQNVMGSPTILYNELTPSWYQQYSYMPVTGVDFDVQIEETVNDGSSSSSSSTFDSNFIYPLRIRVNVNHIPQNLEADYLIDDFRCKMITRWGNNDEYDQILAYPVPGDPKDPEHKYQYFEFEIPNYQDVPPELQRFEFHIEGLAIRRNSKGQIIDEDGNVITPTESEITSDPEQFIAWQPIRKYYTDVVIRKDLSDVMLSSITYSNTWDGESHGSSYKYYVHNVPVILSLYLDDGDGGGVYNRADNINYPNFEVTIMQNLISNLELDDRKMLTDFVNIKFPDTYGPLNNLKYNDIDYIVRSRYRTPFKYETPDDITWGGNTAETLINISANGNPIFGITYPFRYSYLVNGIEVTWQENIFEGIGWGWYSWDTSSPIPSTGKGAMIAETLGNWQGVYLDFDAPANNDAASLSGFINGSNGLDGFTITWGTYPAYGNITQGQNVALSSEMYIVNGPVENYENANKPLSSYINHIAQYYDNLGWYLTPPKLGMYVRVEDELDDNDEEKVLVWDGDEWRDVQSYRIPLKIDLKVELDSKSTISGDEMKRMIREALVTHFSPYMGIQKSIDRSEIVTVVRQIPGVVYCEVRKPEIDITFDYDIKDLTQAQIIDYTPQYVGFVGGDVNYSAAVQDEGIQIEIVR